MGSTCGFTGGFYPLFSSINTHQGCRVEPDSVTVAAACIISSGVYFVHVWFGAEPAYHVN